MAINWNKKKYTKEQLAEAVANNESWRGVAREIGINNLNAGGAYVGIKAAVHELCLDTSHFTGRGWNKGDKMGLSIINTIPLEEILVEHSTYTNTVSLKKRLIRAGLLEEKCAAPFCPVPNPSINPFTGEECELKLSLDHINGNRLDNRIDNLRLLCYHCHGLTDTWCSKNPKRYKKTKRAPAVIENCECGNEKSMRAKLCSDCEYKRRKGIAKEPKIDWPDYPELLDMLAASNYTKVAEQLGCSDNAIRKHLVCKI